MRSTLITCLPETTLGQAAVLLVQHRVHALVVAGADGQPLGILSDTDLLAGEWLSTDAESLAAMRAMTASQLMTQPPAAIEADTPVAQAAARMRSEQIHRLLVLEAGRAVGIISVSDLVAHLGRASVERKIVADVMSRGIVVCLAETPLAAAARAMTERRSRSIIVVNGQGRPQGVITGADLLSIVESGDNAQIAADIMHPLLSIAPTATLIEAADRMLRHHVHRLLVVDPANPEGMPLGLISTSDIVSEMAEAGSVWQSQ
jgi:CBS domain-containing protein